MDAERKTCFNGHPWNNENIGRRTIDGSAYCRACNRERVQRRRTGIPDQFIGGARHYISEKSWLATDLAYLAGLLDGEGCVGVYISRNEMGKGQRCPRNVFRPKLSIVNTDRRMLDWVKSKFGGRIVTSNAPSRPIHHKPKHTWSCDGANNIQQLIKAVRPYLVIKIEQADLILDWPANAICNQWTPEKTSAIQAHKHRLYLATKQLNRRGNNHAMDGR